MSINVNDRVRVISADGELSPLIGAIGEVNRIHELATGRIAIVKIIPDENIAREIFVKFPVENLEKVEPKSEIPEGAKQITKEDFEEALEEMISPEKLTGSEAKNPMISLTKLLTVRLIGDEVKNEIFKDRDVVVMTEDEFISAMWGACNPSAVSGMTGGKMGARKTVKMSITAMISLEEIVGILFGGSDD